MKLRALIQLTRNGRTVHPGEYFRASESEVDGLIADGKAEWLGAPEGFIDVSVFGGTHGVEHRIVPDAPAKPEPRYLPKAAS